MESRTSGESLRPEAADREHSAPAGPPAKEWSRRAILILAAKLLVALLVIAAPAFIATSFVPGVSGVAFFGVLAAAFGWISGGPKIGAAVVVALTGLGVISILLREHTWALALLLVLLGVAYGYAASRGVGKAVLQLPILTPYFMNDPPALFSDPPIVDARYLIGVSVVMLLAGIWTVVVLSLAAGTRHLARLDVPNPRIPLEYGAILGLFSAIVMVVATLSGLQTHWVWITLTLYVLADPQQLFTPAKMWGRVSGTLLGFVVVSALALAGVPDGLLHLLALPALWLCLVFMVIRRPYWQYTLFLTIAVILMDTSDVDTQLLNAERIGFTVIGAALSILVAFLVNLFGFSRVGLSAPERV
ncbi:FUSC family protein [Leucobacter luti]|uniref:Fusaric acid resistance family protein n=1 Tax=Leucobacter luti TaxID=340320 RepID=A0A4Q7TUV3_9MICO|nr:FUSC family protein [Leucobacter luti]MBL3698213.1 hypothetical protein [Leucobacter luti]RZT64704.1 fusaric acid resistance family protein [Leucobacter luti]